MFYFKVVRIFRFLHKSIDSILTIVMIRNAFRLWEQEVNRRGGLLGRPVKLILYDDKSQKELVRWLYKKLILEDKVDLIFSPYGTPLTLEASKVSERQKKVMLVCAASGEQIWERQYQYVFGVYALAKRYFIGLLDLMKKRKYRPKVLGMTIAPIHPDFYQKVGNIAEEYSAHLSGNRMKGSPSPEPSDS